MGPPSWVPGIFDLVVHATLQSAWLPHASDLELVVYTRMPRTTVCLASPPFPPAPHSREQSDGVH